MQSAALLRLLQLVSPALPVGAYAYSQGFESAVEFGLVHDERSAEQWIRGILHLSIATLDAPIFVRMYSAWAVADHESVKRWNQRLHAARETSELRAEDVHMGNALARLLASLDVPDAAGWERESTATFANLFALACAHWNVPLPMALLGLMWAWLENQVAAATKLIPLGQTAAQRLLSKLQADIELHVNESLVLDDDDIGSSVQGLAIISAQHEVQYSRLFRS
jgi:urease accessory protein